MIDLDIYITLLYYTHLYNQFGDNQTLFLFFFEEPRERERGHQ